MCSGFIMKCIIFTLVTLFLSSCSLFKSEGKKEWNTVQKIDILDSADFAENEEPVFCIYQSGGYEMLVSSDILFENVIGYGARMEDVKSGLGRLLDSLVADNETKATNIFGCGWQKLHAGDFDFRMMNIFESGKFFIRRQSDGSFVSSVNIHDKGYNSGPLIAGRDYTVLIGTAVFWMTSITS